MTKFNPAAEYLSKWAPSRETIMAASAAIEDLARWEPCDCGCPNQRSPADKESVDFLRIAAFLRIELMPQNDSCQAPGNE